MKRLLYVAILLALVSLSSCTKSRKEILQDFFKHHHPYEYVEVIEVYEQLDSVYDPYDELMWYFNHPEEVKHAPSVDSVLSEKGKGKNAIGRKARVKYAFSPEDIIVYYDNNDHIKHVSLQNEYFARQAKLRYFDLLHTKVRIGTKRDQDKE